MRKDGLRVTAIEPAATVEFLRRLRSVRLFRPEPVPPPVLDDILAVARWTGSSRNAQPWELIVVTDPAALRAMGAIEGQGNVRFLTDAPLALAILLDGDNPVDETYDEGRMTERIMLAAAAHGLGSNMAWFNDAGARQVRAILGFPERKVFRSAIAIGYPDEDALRARLPRPQPRKPLDQIVSWEQWGVRRASAPRPDADG
jgi:nitroreductase